MREIYFTKIALHVLKTTDYSKKNSWNSYVDHYQIECNIAYLQFTMIMAGIVVVLILVFLVENVSQILKLVLMKNNLIKFGFQNDADPVNLIEKDVMNRIKNAGALTESEYHHLTLSKEGMLGKNQFAITWKGIRDDNNICNDIFDNLFEI